MFPGERTHDLAAFGTAVVHPELPAAHGVLPFMTACDAAPYNLPLAPALNVVGRVLFAIYCAKPFLCKLGIRFMQVLLVRGCFRLNPPADHATIVEVAVRGLIRMMSVGTNAYYQAIGLIGVSAGVAIQFQYVWIAVAIQTLVERKKPGKWTVISSLLVVVGSFFASGMADEVMTGGLTMDPFGLFCSVICALFYAIFIYFSGNVAPNAEPVSKTFFGILGGFALVSCLTPFNGGFGFDAAALAPWGLLMGIVMSIIPVLFIVVANSLISGSLVAVLTSSELPMAVFAGFILLHEGVTSFIVFGVIVILGAIALTQLDSKGKGTDSGREADALAAKD